MICKADHMTVQATDLTTCVVLCFQRDIVGNTCQEETWAQVAEHVCSILSMFFSFFHNSSPTKKKKSDVSLFSYVALLFLSDL